ncbi:MAG: hypothetical protein ACTSV2_17795, partial [Candidatus Thorarchaeota archaeon]
MKKGSYTLILLLVVSCLSPLLLSNNVAAAPGDLVTPGTTMYGTLDDDNPSDFYGIDISEIGYYNFSLSYDGDGSANAFFRYFSSGYPNSMGSLNNEGWRIISISPGTWASSVNGLFQIEIRAENYQEVDYVVKFELIDGVETVPIDTPHDFILEGNMDQVMLFDATSSDESYNFTYQANIGSPVYWYLTFEDGVSVTDGSFFGNSSVMVTLQTGTYYLIFSSGTSSDIDIEIEFKSHDLEIVSPGDSFTVNLDVTDWAQWRHFYRLSLDEGMEYSIELTTDDSVDIAFYIYKGPSTASPSDGFDTWGLGGDENVTDYVLYGQYSAWTGWDIDESFEYVRHYFHSSTNYEGVALDHSRMMLAIYCFGGSGEATLSISAGTPVDTFAVDSSMSTNFDNYDGALWKLYRVTGGSAMSLYTVDIEHTGTGSSNLTTSYKYYLPYINNNNYAYYTKPFISDSTQALYEHRLTSMFYDYWYSYESEDIQHESYFQPMEGDGWLLLAVPDGIIGSSPTLAGLLEGSVDVTITKTAPLPYTIGTPVQFDPDPDVPVLYTTNLLAGHTYRWEFTPENQASGSYYCSFVNTTGHYLPSLPMGYFYANPYPGDFDTRRGDIYATNTMDIAIILTGTGDAPVSFVLIDIFPGVDTIFVIIGL